MFKAPFSFNGRIRRTEYGISAIIYIIFYFFIKTVVEPGQGAIKILGLLYLPILWFLWAQGAKRCHDLNKSGWWQIIPFYFFWMLFERGNPEPNRFDDGFIDGMIYGAGDYERPYMVEDPDPIIGLGGAIVAAAVADEIMDNEFAQGDTQQDDQSYDDDNSYSSDDDDN